MNIPAIMKCIQVTSPGGAEKLALQNTSVPQPGAGQVLIRVMASGVNRADILQRQGKYPVPKGASDILGLEVSGEVVALGAGAQQFTVGDMVCALLIGGGYAEYAVADAALCLPIPDSVSVIDAAGLPEAAFTAHSNLITAAKLNVGETILIHGGSSGIGTFAIQLARAIGARVFTTVGSEDKQAFCEELGAEVAINYTQEDFAARILKLTDSKGVNVVLDMVGAETTERSLEILTTGGRLVVISCPNGAKISLDLSRLMQKRQQVIGTTLRSRPLAEKITIGDAVRAQIWPLISSGQIRPVIYQTLKLSEAAVAHRILESRQHIGKIVLTEG